MKKFKILLSGALIAITLSSTGCCLLDPFWGAPHGGGHGGGRF